MTKVVVCWSDISGYMAACWRSLATLPEVELFVIAFQARTQTVFSDELMTGIPCRLLDIQERDDRRLIEQLISDKKPDVVVVCGWFHTPYRQLAFLPQFQHLTFVMCMDTPWWGSWKQYLTPLLLRSYLRRMAYVVVNGERSWQYARRLGIPAKNISSLGMCGVDYQNLSPLLAERNQSPWPRSFLFVGRYSQEKGIDTLVAAYERYRQQVADPWQLVCCGKGELESELTNRPGIDNRGFLQPDELKTVWLKAGAFLLPSRFDPWPLALIEAAAAGLPVICTQVCGSSVEAIRSGYNGITIPVDDVEALTQALMTVHDRYEDLPLWGKRAQQHAEPYSAQQWAERWARIVKSISNIDILAT